MLCAAFTESNVPTAWNRADQGGDGLCPPVPLVCQLSLLCVQFHNFLKITVDKSGILMYSISCSEQSGTCASGSAVEHLLAKEGVAGSIPVSRSLLQLGISHKPGFRIPPFSPVTHESMHHFFYAVLRLPIVVNSRFVHLLPKSRPKGKLFIWGDDKYCNTNADGQSICK